MGPTDNKLALVQIMAWWRLGDKPLFEPFMAYFSDAYSRHSASLCSYSLESIRVAYISGVREVYFNL